MSENRNSFSCQREELPMLYAEALFQNPLLQRLENELRIIGWTDEEIRTVQLLTACKSNASLTEYAKSIESRIANTHLPTNKMNNRR